MTIPTHHTMSYKIVKHITLSTHISFYKLLHSLKFPGLNQLIYSQENSTTSHESLAVV